MRARMSKTAVEVEKEIEGANKIMHVQIGPNGQLCADLKRPAQKD